MGAKCHIQLGEEKKNVACSFTRGLFVDGDIKDITTGNDSADLPGPKCLTHMMQVTGT